MLSYILGLVLASSTPVVSLPSSALPQPFLVSNYALAMEIKPEATSTSVEGMISFYAEKYEVSSSTMYATLKCESNFRSDAIGDQGRSFGIAQFFLPAGNKTEDGQVITKEMAQNNEIAISTMAYYFKIGHARKWTCWRNLVRDT